MPDASTFQCTSCGADFQVRPDVLARYPGWTPRVCLSCKKTGASTTSGKKGAGTSSRKRSPRKPSEPAVDPKHGIFTDGACSGNPGPGGWAAVRVVDDVLIEERHGREDRTTNNRMEMRALIEAFRMLPADSTETIWSDSNLCVRTLNEWAEGWKRRGWKRKTGPVENLDLVREAYELKRSRPGVELRWIKGHAGRKWNEVADRLATTGSVD